MIKEGQVLNERYRLVRPLGQGSQAFVWVAEHLALGSHVAVKLIDPELAKQDDARERFRREATAAAKLRSAHVVQILDHGIEGDQPFIVMELLEGEDLFQRLDHAGHLPIQQVSRIVTQVARALMRAHAEGIVHRDLKPENVFIIANDDDEVVKVLDFGVAKITTPHKAQMTKTGAGTLIGTPHYMSPEQVKGIGEIDHRSDLWSLAVIAYQAATGHLPFDSEGVGDLLIKISLHHPRPPSELVPDLPQAFDDWFEKASAKDPADRYQSARELAEALARAAGFEPRPSAQKTEGRVELDWGPDSFTNPGRRIADLLKAAAAPPPPERTPRRPAAKADDIEVVEGSMPPPPQPPASSAGEGAKPPRPPPKPAPSKSGARAAQDAGAVPLWDLPKNGTKPSQPPSSAAGRALASTVTGLSSSGSSIVPPPELDGSGKRRVLWFFAVAFAIGAIALTVSVIRSQMITTDARNAAPADSGVPFVAPTPAPTAVVSASPTPSTSSSASAVDPSVTKKPSTSAVKPTGPGVPPLARTVKTSNGDIEIWVPLPDKEVPRR